MHSSADWASERFRAPRQAARGRAPERFPGSPPSRPGQRIGTVSGLPAKRPEQNIGNAANGAEQLYKSLQSGESIPPSAALPRPQPIRQNRAHLPLTHSIRAAPAAQTPIQMATTGIHPAASATAPKP